MTFVELIMVLVLIGILAAAAGPSLSGVAIFKAEGAARKVMQDLRYAQAVAMQQRRTVGMTIELANDRYRAFYVSSGINVSDPVSGSPGVFEQDWGSGLVTDFQSHPELAGVDIAATSANLGTGLRFDSMGRPRDGVGTVLSSDGTMTLQHGSVPGYAWILQIDDQTGRVNYQRVEP